MKPFYYAIAFAVTTLLMYPTPKPLVIEDECLVDHLTAGGSISEEDFNTWNN